MNNDKITQAILSTGASPLALEEGLALVEAWMAGRVCEGKEIEAVECGFVCELERDVIVIGVQDLLTRESARCPDEGCPHYGTGHSHPNEDEIVGNVVDRVDRLGARGDVALAIIRRADDAHSRQHRGNNQRLPRDACGTGRRRSAQRLRAGAEDPSRRHARSRNGRWAPSGTRRRRATRVQRARPGPPPPPRRHSAPGRTRRRTHRPAYPSPAHHDRRTPPAKAAAALRADPHTARRAASTGASSPRCR